METFMERIIETDRRAREVIEKALAQREGDLAAARKQAQEEVRKRTEALRAEMDTIDREAGKSRAQSAQEADREYLSAKHALDAAFEEKREDWLKRICSRAAGL